MESNGRSGYRDLSSLFQRLQVQLSADLYSKQVIIDHGPSKGRASELDWMNMLKTHLPTRYNAGSAFIVDSRGKISEQIDIVIYDHHYSPVFYEEGDFKIIPAEAVYAIIEVKTKLNKEKLSEASQKARSVRSLYRTTDSIPHAGGKFDSVTPKYIPSGIVATSCEWSPCLELPFENTIKSFDALGQIDFGCVIQSGSFDINYTDFSIQKSDQNNISVFFFLSLLRRLAQIATVPKIKLEEYAVNVFSQFGSLNTLDKLHTREQIKEKILKWIQLEDTWKVDEADDPNYEIGYWLSNDASKIFVGLEKKMDRVGIHKVITLDYANKNSYRLSPFHRDFWFDLKVKLMYLGINIEAFPNFDTPEIFDLFEYIYFDSFTRDRLIHSLIRVKNGEGLCNYLWEKFGQSQRSESASEGGGK